MKNQKTTYPTLAGALDAEYRTDDLRKMAALICSTKPTRKRERIEAIINTLFKDLKQIFEQLSPIAQHAVSETVHTWRGIFEGRMFEAKYSDSPWHQEEKSYSRSLQLLDLFLVKGSIPMDLYEKLREVVPKPIEDDFHYIDDLSQDDYFVEELVTVRETSRAALANLSMLLNLIDDKKIRVSAKTGRGTAATVRNINEMLYEGDWYDDEEIGPIQSFAWPLLLQGGKLARGDGSFLKLTPAGRKALKKDLAGGIKLVWQKWEKTKILDEFSRVTAIKGQKAHRGRTMTTPVRRRPMIHNLLEDLQPGRWIDLDELNRVMQSNSLYSFDMVNYAWKLYLLDQHYGHLDYYDTWPLLQFRYLLVYMFEYCATLGLVDVAYTDPRGARTDYHECWGADDLAFLSHCDGLQYIRVNDLGAFVLGYTDTYEVKNDNSEVFEFEGTDLLLIKGTSLPPGQTLYLEKIGERKNGDRWSLSIASLLGAMKVGESLAEIRKMLESISSAGFSTEMEQLFQDVEQRSTAFVEVGKASLIKCGTEFRKQVLTHNKLSGLCLPAGENYLAVLPGKEKLFARAIESAGFIIGRKK